MLVTRNEARPDPRFTADWTSLPEVHRRLFRRVVPDYAAACEAYAASRGTYVWPQKLPVTPMVNVPGCGK
ncbi:hypothetical protein SAMN06264364_1552 [Quadrisphaera granulorum]|uniref:Uncharacterized protein n=1 Tax=Quadrisphaera granulorum TaxID=317664 RepID=A0A315ZJ20_9ACTN|nr:hypothetical protein BXY45_1552 [Quadrisphaera granulorum]SZE99166.1 hypothetical protein SAMN06264364_1552 [Quadrisphaera granulorum]